MAVNTIAFLWDILDVRSKVIVVFFAAAFFADVIVKVKILSLLVRATPLAKLGETLPAFFCAPDRSKSA